MGQNKMLITEAELQEIVTQATLNTLQQIHAELLVEYQQINVDDSNNAIFPYNKFVVSIYSDDHWPPHFHVEGNGWNISLTIWKGEVLQAKGDGTQADYNYIAQNALKWLNTRSSVNKRKSNRQIAIITWNRMHSTMPIQYRSKDTHLNPQKRAIKNWKKGVR